MNDWQLVNLAAKCPRLEAGIFRGVFASDKLPGVTPLRQGQTGDRAFIVNIDPSGMPGSHWIAIYVPKVPDQPIEYFDSYGLVPYVKSIQTFVGLPDQFVLFNDITLQAPFSSTCGQYSLLYIYLRAHEFSFNDILSVFRWSNPWFNDNLVNTAIENLFGTSLVVYDMDFIKRQIATAFDPGAFENNQVLADFYGS